MSVQTRRWQLALVAAVLVVAAFFAVVKKIKVELPVYGKVPVFQLRDQTGSDFSSEQLIKHVWVAGFIFTRCMGPCPVISAKMSELKKRLHYSPRFALVSFTVDPDYDTSEKLAAYSAKFNQEGSPLWHFLTGAKDKIYELALKTFMQTASDDPAQPELQARFMHGTRLALVDGEGQIRGFYDSQDSDAINKLELDIRSLL